jgi:hypothetical protein
MYFAVLEEIYNNVVPHWSAVLISRNHSITRLISYMDPEHIRLIHIGLHRILTKPISDKPMGPI